MYVWRWFGVSIANSKGVGRGHEDRHIVGFTTLGNLATTRQLERNSEVRQPLLTFATLHHVRVPGCLNPTFHPQYPSESDSFADPGLPLKSIFAEA